jgi:putative IMPACT (imprinted ancient) family translation regulator
MGPRLDEFSSDAGEPKGSAGQPILNALRRQYLINSGIFVIRYYGGAKLGIPGLIHAYGVTAENAIKNASLKPWMEKKRLLVTYPYTLEGVMKSILKKNHIEVIYEDFGEKIDIQLDIDVELADSFIDIIKELSAGSAQIIMTE